MSHDLDQAAGGGLGLAFILSEIRDLRKGMETRDESLRGSIDSVRDSVNLLSAKVDRSQGDVDSMKNDVDSIREQIGAIRTDVDGIIKEQSDAKLVKESSWAGPRKILRNLAMIGAGIGGLLAIINFWPAIGPWLAAVTLPPAP